MAFATSLSVTNSIATIFLKGDLDASTANDFKLKIEEAAKYEPKPTKLVLHFEDLDYMASAGLRMLIFSKQQMGNNLKLYIFKPNEMVWETLTKTGFHHSVKVLEDYDLDAIAKL
ncbi:anti-sigma factor antagonist [Microcystis aeruginosa]|uniref:Anti-sigma factor antagonist n=1 Tax=Microcystis aeruginosa NIES-3787 TaxID=2517782 RepID=A0A6H9FSS8_MICAE|nr:anti-sigma factor antagonist [Microcystis aeruginosa]GCL47953.1 anti-sigma-factor antagonist [Microcystis aeruginosa NIES-3787]